MSHALNVVILGLSISSSWGNGHATTYRALVRGLQRSGHRVLFLERDMPWYAAHRDAADPSCGTLRLYGSLEELRQTQAEAVADADLVMVGSYVPEGAVAAQWVLDTARGVTAFYDIDTPVTLAKLADGDFEYLHPGLIPQFDLYLSFTGGPMLQKLRRAYRARRAAPLYCSVDPELYRPEAVEPIYDLGYMGTFSEDRQPTVEALLLEPARVWGDGRFAVAGPQYPDTHLWPKNVHHVDHLPPDEHSRFYAEQRFTLNVTRQAMIRAGYSPSVRLFEAAACATPVISDYWRGLDHFFRIGEEILVAARAGDVLEYLRRWPEEQRRRLGERARARVLAAHTAEHRAEELEGYVHEARAERIRTARPPGRRVHLRT